MERLQVNFILSTTDKEEKHTKQICVRLTLMLIKLYN